MERCLTTIKAVRSAKTLYGMSRRQLPRVALVSEATNDLRPLRENANLIQTLAPCGAIIDYKPDQMNNWSKQIVENVTVYIELEGQIDAQLELKKLSQKISKLEATRTKLQSKLNKRLRDEDKAK